MSITFEKNNDESLRACAVYVSQLVREGFTFKIHDRSDVVEVELISYSTAYTKLSLLKRSLK